MTDAVQQVFLALADPTRRLLMQRITSVGPQTATQLAADLPITRQGVTKHLGILAEAGLVTVHQQGRDKRYSLTPEPMIEAVSWINSIGALWDQRLEAIRQLFEDENQE